MDHNFVGIATEILKNTEAISTVSGKLLGPVFKLVTAAYGILVFWHGFNIIRGNGGSNALLDLFAKSLRTLFIIGLCTGAGSYKSNIEDLIDNSRASLVKAIYTAPGGGGVSDKLAGYKQIDEVMDAAKKARGVIIDWGWDHVGIGFFYIHLYGFVAIILGWIMFLMMLVFGIVACVYLLVIDLSLAVMLAFGPIFFACAAFESTAKFFDTWLGGVLKYIFTAAVVACVLALALGVMGSFAEELKNTSDDGFIDLVVIALATAGILILVLMNAPQLAMDMVGGAAMSLNPAQMARSAVGAARTAAGKAGGAAGSVAGAAGSVAGGAARAGAFAYGRSQRSGANSDGGGNSGPPQSKTAKVINAMRGMQNFARAVGGKGASSKGFASSISSAAFRGQHGMSRSSHREKSMRPVVPTHRA